MIRSSQYKSVRIIITYFFRRYSCDCDPLLQYVFYDYRICTDHAVTCNFYIAYYFAPGPQENTVAYFRGFFSAGGSYSNAFMDPEIIPDLCGTVDKNATCVSDAQTFPQVLGGMLIPNFAEYMLYKK